MNLPKDKKLIRVTFEYEGGDIYCLDENNSKNFNDNINATVIMAIRGHKFAEVDWAKLSRSMPLSEESNF